MDIFRDKLTSDIIFKSVSQKRQLGKNSTLEEVHHWHAGVMGSASSSFVRDVIYSVFTST